MARARDPRRPRFRLAYIPMLLLAMAAAGCLQRRAALEVSTREIDFGSQLDSTSFNVKNAGKDGLLTAGVSALDYDISVDKDWLTVTPASGRCGGGQQSAHVVEIDRSLLLLGNNIATILISSNDGPWSIMVRADNVLTTCIDPPTEPWNPAPGNGATGVPIGADLVWNDGASRCPGLTATYDVRFGTSAPPPFDHDNGSSKIWDPGTLANGTTYYWQIVAKDANGSTPGPVWSFTTSDAPCTAGPGAVTLVAPGNGATSVSIDQNLSWGGGASQCPGLTATYDVRFGTSAPPPFDHDNGSSKIWDPGTLANGTTYYCQIVAKDANGSTPGPVWSFTTEVPCFTMPTVACTPSPADRASNVNENANLAWGCGDSQCSGLVATYDVYFGTNPTPGPGEFLGNAAARAWDLPRQAKNTTFYWQIVTRDRNGSSPGPVWSFTTRH
jgi:Viral BACON domain